MTDNPGQGAYGWHKSSYSADAENCVETGRLPASIGAVIAVRDTKHRAARRLAFPAPAWGAFLDGLKHDTDRP